MSRDHDWGCRLTLLVDGRDAGAVLPVMELLERELPASYRGLAVRFPVTWDSSLSHKVEVATVAGFAASRLGVDPLAGLSVPDWLILTGQSVLEVTAGPVFTDSTRELARAAGPRCASPTARGPGRPEHSRACGPPARHCRFPSPGHTAMPRAGPPRTPGARAGRHIPGG